MKTSDVVNTLHQLVIDLNNFSYIEKYTYEITLDNLVIITIKFKSDCDKYNFEDLLERINDMVSYIRLVEDANVKVDWIY